MLVDEKDWLAARQQLLATGSDEPLVSPAELAALRPKSQPGSLATLLTAVDQTARLFLDYRLGRIMPAADAEEL